MKFTITDASGKSLYITIPYWMVSMTIGSVKKQMENQYGIPYDSMSLMNKLSPSSDPMEDIEAVVEGMNLLAIVEPTVTEEKKICMDATLKGTFSTITNVPYKGKLTVKCNKNSRTYNIERFFDISSRYDNVFRPDMISSIRWETPTETGSIDVTVFHLVDSIHYDKPLLSDLHIDPETGELKPFRCPCPEHPDSPTNLIVSGYLTVHAGTPDEVVIPVASDNNEGVCVDDGTLVCGFKNVESVVTKEGKLTWTVRVCEVVVQGFVRLKHAAIMADIIHYYMDPHASTMWQFASVKDFNMAQPTPWQLNTPEWQEVLRQPNVEELLTMTEVPVKQSDITCLEFLLRMLMSLAVNKLVTVEGEGSRVSDHGELFERVNALSKLVPSGVDDECPRTLSEVVSIWKLLFVAYTQAVGGADSSVSLVPINHPRDVDYTRGAPIIMKLGSSFYIAQLSFMTTRCMNDGCLPVVFPWRSIMYSQHVHPAINRVFMFGETSNEPAYKKHRCE